MAKKYNCEINGTQYYKVSATIDGKRRYFYGDGQQDAYRQRDEAKALAEAGVSYDHNRTASSPCSRTGSSISSG